MINSLADLLKPSGVDTAKLAIESLANCVTDKAPYTYTNPTIATALRTMLKEISEMRRNSLSKENKNAVSIIIHFIHFFYKVTWTFKVYLNFFQESQEASEFGRIFCFEFASEIGRLATTTQLKKTMRKEVIIPTTTEIGIFFKYVSDIREAAYNEVIRPRAEGEKFPVTQWYQLAKASMVCLEVLNRRRPGDVEKIEIADYDRLKRIESDSDEYKNMSEADKV